MVEANYLLRELMSKLDKLSVSEKNAMNKQIFDMSYTISGELCVDT
jgi:hypothetical protein